MIRRLAVAALLALPLGTAVACSSSPPSCDAPTATTTVDMQENLFAPACAEAHATDTLTLVNHDDIPHTYTVKSTDVNVKLDGGATATAALTGIAPGTYAVTCLYHPQMTATLRVG